VTQLDGRYAARLIPHAERIVAAVHDDGPDALLDAIRDAVDLPHPGEVDPFVALCTVLAAMVNPATTTSQRLGWVTAFDVPEARPPVHSTGPVGEHLTLHRTGIYHDLKPADRIRVVAELTAKGLTAEAIATQLRTTARTINRARARARTAEQHAGTTLKEAG
jgi:DNA-binding NarL/FixJ family response regulator